MKSPLKLQDDWGRGRGQGRDTRELKHSGEPLSNFSECAYFREELNDITKGTISDRKKWTHGGRARQLDRDLRLQVDMIGITVFPQVFPYLYIALPIKIKEITLLLLSLLLLLLLLLLL